MTAPFKRRPFTRKTTTNLARKQRRKARKQQASLRSDPTWQKASQKTN